MGISLTSLTSRLQNAVPPRNGVPDDAGYQQAVEDAVADFGRRVSLLKQYTIPVVSGTATYTLPADFVRAVRLVDLPNQDGVLVTDSGIIPVSADFNESYTIAGNQITFYPTPQYSANRYLWYGAGHVLVNGEYLELTEAAAQVVLLKAQALVLQAQANRAAQEAWSYAIGDERVDKGRVPEALGKRIEALLAQYETAVRDLVGPVGKRGGR